ncbi:ABC transporter permease [Rhizobium sp. ZPR3]|uniref:ABC transporter permease n=2 Tax=unclassified Rhizobium TaxID=2613769 RepID=A0AAU7SR25_9HYPH
MLDGRPAFTVVWERIPATLAIAIPALIVKMAIGVPAGTFSALRRGSWVDQLLMTSAIFGLAVPGFVVGLCLIMVFSVELGWLPSGGAGSIKHALLPVATLGLFGAATLARYTRSAVSDVLSQPYVRAAIIKGIPRRRIVLFHVLPNAAIPIITIVGLMIGSSVAGAVVIESVFSWPGVGRLLVTSVANRDLAVVQSILLFVGFSMVLANFGVDLLYGLVDPRMRRQATSGARR